MTDSQLDISVIVPFFNEESYLAGCIDSLLAQDLDRKKFELIFVNNNSMDASVELVSRYSEVKLIHQRSGREYSCRNKAAQVAEGRILAFIDADCVAESDWLSKILTELDQYDLDMVVGKRFFSPRASFMSQYLRDYENSKIEFVLKNRLLDRVFAYTNNMAVTRTVFDALDGFIEDIPLADTNFAQRYVEAYPQCRYRYSGDIVVHHMEIKKWGDWIRKLYSYGARSPTSGISIHISLGLQIRMYRFCFAKHGYTLTDKALFVFSALSAALAFLIPFHLGGGESHFAGKKRVS